MFSFLFIYGRIIEEWKRIGGINMGFIKNLMKSDSGSEVVENEYYDISTEEAYEAEGGAKMILLEPRAFSESQQIADHLK